jgi:NifU-like protein involved in Fe-S cluster formation
MTSNARRGLSDNEMKILYNAGYSDRSIDYILDQVNVGVIKKPDIKHVQIGECGDILLLFINLSKDSKIKKIKFKYAGCPALSASGSSMTELAKGKTIEKANNLTVEDLMRDLVSLPENHKHCPVLALETLKTALKPYLGKKILNQKEHDKYVHYCGLTGKELDTMKHVPCNECNHQENCEGDHIIIRARKNESL